MNLKEVVLKQIFLCLIIALLPLECFAQESEIVRIFISGRVLNSHKEPVREAKVKLMIDNVAYKFPSGKEYVSTSIEGFYNLEALLSREKLEKSKLFLEIQKTNYKKVRLEIKKEEFAKKETNFYAVKDVTLERYLAPSFYIGTTIFFIVYLLIAFEILHRTVASLLGAALMLFISYTLGTLNPDYQILTFEKAIESIDLNVIFLLIGMMIIIGVLKKTGVFQWCAYMSYKIARGNLIVLNAISCFFIAVTSAFLDNVTTMLLYTPVLIEIAAALKISPFSLILPGIMASNVGGTATLIGDPPNIMIGSYASLSFIEFIKNLTLVCVFSTFVLIFYNQIFYGKEYKKSKISDIDQFLNYLRERFKITDAKLLGYGLFILAFIVALFLTHHYWHMEVCIPALFGGSLLLTYSIFTKKIKLAELIEKDIEWNTLLFFVFLFMIVGGVEEVGLLALIADWVYHLSQGNLLVAVTLILWVSAIMSAFVDNIPFTATMLPIVAYLTKTIPGAETNVLWWALAFGACFGGNGTLIGASANVVTVGILENTGYKITFMEFTKYAFFYMIITIFFAQIWLMLFY